MRGSFGRREEGAEAAEVAKLGRSIAGGKQPLVGEAQFVDAVLRTAELKQLAKARLPFLGFFRIPHHKGFTVPSRA